MKLTERLGKEWIFFDGGMGTILQEHGLKAGELPETWNLSHPDEIIALNRSYFEAGCDVVNTNTFGANALKYPDNLQEIVQAAVSHAKTARQQAGREDAYIALDIGPTGKLLQPMGDLPFAGGRAVRRNHSHRCGGGADLVLIETMSDSYEAKAAVLAAKENCDLPVLVTLIFDEKGKLLTGGTVDSTVAMLEGLRVDALGVNCGLGPKQMHPIIERLTQVSSLPIIVNPNAGLPRSE
ncbi:MAG: homocysteine S-methyltransferase family protein, partial [Butyricicoccus sp.]